MKRRRRLGGLAAAAALVVVMVPAAAVAQVAAGRDAAQVRREALAAASGWRDLLEAHRAPQRPTPGDTESAIVVLEGPPAIAAAPGDRAAAAAEITARQEAVEASLRGMGATIGHRYRVLLNGLSVEIPAGRLESIAALPSVRAVVPVSFLAPAAAASGDAGEAAATAAAPPSAVPPTPGRPAHIALIDGAVDASHPWLGGGIGPTFPIIGGADLVTGDGDPTPGAPDEAGADHGTELASLVLRSPALAGLAPERFPRLLAYRVVAGEAVEGRLRPLARSDRVLAALETAVDPDRDGDPSDHAEVILIGLAEGFAGRAGDPVAQAVAAADRAGSTVVVPAGNDGPTFSLPGSVGGPAAVPTAIAVGGITPARAPRTATMHVSLGPAAAALGPLPLMGPPAGGAAPVALVRSPDGLGAGDDPAEYRDAEGRSRVRGAVAVVGRGGGTIPEKAELAAAAGAVALAVWDVEGPAVFPGVAGPGLPIPVVGLGPRQGRALAEIAASRPGLRATIAERPAGPVRRALGSFSSWGPTPDGRPKPDLVAPAVDLPAATTGRTPAGAPRAADVTGTSAAAALVAARALRLRVDRPELGPRDVHGILVQSATPLPGVAAGRQGAGVLGDTLATPDVAIDPPLVAVRPRRARVSLVLRDLTGAPGRYRLWLRDAGGGTVAIGPVVDLAGGGSAEVRAALPAGAAGGRLVVTRDGTEAVVASAPVMALRPASTERAALGRPEVQVVEGRAHVRVRIGRLEREGGRVQSARLHGVRFTLLPVDGGDPLMVSGAKSPAEWPAGAYRFLVADRLADGRAAPPGRYRLRVAGTGADGAVLTRDSAPFSLD
ncbi:MAG: minor extracellular serine protease Vpr [Miltoncostaeaceae bacterium]|nr:minor extracellular serine protease Vpr [Miltoncostaeaceae bacterium]